MQVMPLLTPTNFLTNTKKRTRSTVDDFESHYLKKRLIATITELEKDIFRGYGDESPEPIQIDDCKLTEIEEEEMNVDQGSYSRIHVLDINGTMLPMERKPGESKYSIPDFVLGGGGTGTINQGQLILYQNKSLFDQLLPPEQELEDNSSSDDEEFEPMEID